MEEKPAHPKPVPNRKKGIIFILISWLFLTSVVALARIVSSRTSVPTVLFFQNCVSMLVMLPWIVKAGLDSLRLNKIGVLAIRALAGYSGYAFTFLAVQRISLVNTVLLSNSAPLFIPLVIWLWKRVKISKGLWVGIIIGFIGIGFILKPGREMFNFGAIFAIGSAIMLSISTIAQRRLVKTEPVRTILFYYFVIGTILSIPFCIDQWKPLDGQTFGLLILIGILFVTGQIFFLNALRYEKPSFLSSFNYSSVVYGAIIQWALWGILPTWMTVVGIIIVCTGGIITIVHGKGVTFPPKG